MTKINPADILALIELFNASVWQELHVEVDGLQLFLSRDPAARLASGPALATSGAMFAPAALNAAPSAPTAAITSSAAAPAASGTPAAASVPAHWVPVKAPNLGTFYRAPKPGAQPYVGEGQQVDAETEVCLLEVMKLFTSVRAGHRGTIRRICAVDGSMVESGAVLFYIEPA